MLYNENEKEKDNFSKFSDTETNIDPAEVTLTDFIETTDSKAVDWNFFLAAYGINNKKINRNKINSNKINSNKINNNKIKNSNSRNFSALSYIKYALWLISRDLKLLIEV